MRKRGIILEKEKLLSQSFSYLLDLLCYAYYVKCDPLIDDISFDKLEKVYEKLFDTQFAPSRAMEREECYTNGVKVIYYAIKDRKNDK